MSDVQLPRDAWVLATWAALLHGAGFTPNHPSVRAACDALVVAASGAPTRAAGEALVVEVAAVLGQGGVVDAATALFGDLMGTTFAARTREARGQRLRTYAFQHGLPWLAQLWERDPRTGEVRAAWHVILSADALVHVLDPNPYDDVDENRTLPIGDFHVLWELSGNAHVHVVRPAADVGTGA